MYFLTKITVAHSPDSDDAFMFYALAEKKVQTGKFEFDHVLGDIETLNHAAMEGKYEVSAISIHAYPYVADKYALLRSGASMGYRYGPIVVSKKSLDRIRGKMVAVPGKLTSAYLELRLFEEDFTPVVMKFDGIIDAVESGVVDAGLIIHEGQLTYKYHNLHKVVDLGEWWYEETRLPLPLGGNVIRKDLGWETMEEVSGYIKESIVYALEHEDEALDYAMRYGGELLRLKGEKGEKGENSNRLDSSRSLDEVREDVRRFVKMYVNEYTADYGNDGMKAIKLLLDMAYEKGMLERKVSVEFL